MKNQHPQLAKGRWEKLSLMEQLANVGSEVIRASNWKQKNNSEYSKLAFYRALELLSYCFTDSKNKSKLRELTRMYELLVDYFEGTNIYRSSAEKLNKQFISYTFAAQLDRKLGKPARSARLVLIKLAKLT